MAKWVLVMETNATDVAHEVEFNEWYNKIHLPDVLETPGFIRATRYENTRPSKEKAKFLAIYEIEADDIDKVMKALQDNVAKRRAEGRMSNLLVGVSRGVYKQIYSLSK